MEKKEEKKNGKGHVLVLPFPIQGHINPMLQFAKRLISKGLNVTLLTTSSTHRKIVQLKSPSLAIHIHPLFDGFQEGKLIEATDEHFQQFHKIVSQSLADLIELKQSPAIQENPPNYIVYDCVLPWVLTVARRFGLRGAPFFTQSNVVNAIGYHFLKGKFKDGDEEVSLPSIPKLKGNELPTFFYDKNSCPALLNLILGQFGNLHEADCLLVNSFDELEAEVLNWTEHPWPIKNIGPTIPSMFLDKRLQDDKKYGLSLFKPNEDECLKWLDSMQQRSVVYVSFGSLAVLGDEQMNEIALGLKQSNYFFLWVVRETELKKLPEHFSDSVSEKGLVVTWSPQLEVLAHESVGCFMTHCGWNSTLEALSLGVPMVTMPRWSDQPTNAKFVTDVWKVGIRVEVYGTNGFVKKEEIVRCLKEIMEGDKREEMKTNSEKWKELSVKAVSEGGSSDKNIEDLIAKISSF